MTCYWLLTILCVLEYDDDSEAMQIYIKLKRLLKPIWKNKLEYIYIQNFIHTWKHCLLGGERMVVYRGGWQKRSQKNTHCNQENTFSYGSTFSYVKENFSKLWWEKPLGAYFPSTFIVLHEDLQRKQPFSKCCDSQRYLDQSKDLKKTLKTSHQTRKW